MYSLKYSKKFRKDIKRAHRKKIVDLKKLRKILDTLSLEEKLVKKYYHHKLHGKLKDCYAYHLRPDLVLIYQKDKKNKIIYLLRIGSHSELF